MNKGKAKEIRAKLNALDPASDGFDAEIRGLYEQVMGAAAGSSIPSERVYKSITEALDEVLGVDEDGGLPPKESKRKPKAEAAPKGVRTFKAERKLPVTLTEEDRLARGAAIGDAVDKRTKLEAEVMVLKAQAKGLMQRVSVLDDEIAHLGDVLKTGVETRNVEVAVTLDLKNGRYEEIRTDTGEVTVDRPLQGNERQGQLALTDGGGSDDEDTDGEGQEVSE